MNEERIKSAIELALEKTGHIGEKARTERIPLTEEMKKEIDEIEKECGAKIAERDVMLQAELKKLYLSMPPAEAEQHGIVLQAKFKEEKEALQNEKNGKIESIKKQAAGE